MPFVTEAALHTLSGALKQKRLASGTAAGREMSYYQAADLCSIDLGTYQKFENGPGEGGGRRTNQDTLDGIQQFLGWDYAEMRTVLDGGSPPQPKPGTAEVLAKIIKTAYEQGARRGHAREMDDILGALAEMREVLNGGLPPQPLPEVVEALAEVMKTVVVQGDRSGLSRAMNDILRALRREVKPRSTGEHGDIAG